MSGVIYIEGGGDSKLLKIRCREGFRGLFDKLDLEGRRPHLVACGGRDAAFEHFRTGMNDEAFVALLVDSEEPVVRESQWEHLRERDNWVKPQGATDDQVLLMTTCMETWIVADRVALRRHYGSRLRETALPPTDNLEARTRHEVQTALVRATATCSNAYEKGKRSFRALAELSPNVLSALLPSFARIQRILEDKL